MPRESAASMAVVKPQKGAGLLQPRAATPAAVAEVFRELVASEGPDHFRLSDRPMVEELARSIWMLREAGDALARDGLMLDGTVHPCVKVVQKQETIVAMLSTRLRLTPQSRYTARTAGNKPAGGLDVDFGRLP